MGFLTLCFPLQGFLSLLQLPGHGIKRLGKLSQKGYRLRIIPLGYLLGLPGQMIQIGMHVLQILTQEIIPVRNLG